MNFILVFLLLLPRTKFESLVHITMGTVQTRSGKLKAAGQGMAWGPQTGPLYMA